MQIIYLYSFSTCIYFMHSLCDDKRNLPWLHSLRPLSTEMPPLVFPVYVIVEHPDVCCVFCCHLTTDLNTLLWMLRSLSSTWMCICSPPSCSSQSMDSLKAMTNLSVNWFVFFFILFLVLYVLFFKKKKEKEKNQWTWNQMIFLWNDSKMSSVF